MEIIGGERETEREAETQPVCEGTFITKPARSS